MKRNQLWLAMLAIIFLTGAFLGCPRTKPPQANQKKTIPGDEITRDNSPQYAKDYDNIDSLYFTVNGECKIDDRGNLKYTKDSWRLDLRPEEAIAAHDFLRELLHSYPLSRSFRGTQTRFRTAENIAIAFYHKTGETGENVFDIQIFSADPSYMEIHHRLGVEGSGQTAVVTGLAGTEVSLEGPVKVKLFSFLADCAAKAKKKKNSP